MCGLETGNFNLFKEFSQPNFRVNNGGRGLFKDSTANGTKKIRAGKFGR